MVNSLSFLCAIGSQLERECSGSGVGSLRAMREDLKPALR